MRILRHAPHFAQADHIHCIERLCAALTSVLLYEPNQVHFHGKTAAVDASKCRMLLCVCVL